MHKEIESFLYPARRALEAFSSDYHLRTTKYKKVDRWTPRLTCTLAWHVPWRICISNRNFFKRNPLPAQLSQLLLSKCDLMANSEACYTRRGTANRKKCSAGVALTESFPERCCLGVPVADTSYQLPTARAPGQPAATAYCYLTDESSNQVAFDHSSFMTQRNHILDSRLDHECRQSVPRRIPHCRNYSAASSLSNEFSDFSAKKQITKKYLLKNADNNLCDLKHHQQHHQLSNNGPLYVSNYRNISDSQCDGDRETVPAYHANIYSTVAPTGGSPWEAQSLDRSDAGLGEAESHLLGPVRHQVCHGAKRCFRGVAKNVKFRAANLTFWNDHQRAWDSDAVQGLQFSLPVTPHAIDVEGQLVIPTKTLQPERLKHYFALIVKGARQPNGSNNRDARLSNCLLESCRSGWMSGMGMNVRWSLCRFQCKPSVFHSRSSSAEDTSSGGRSINASVSLLAHFLRAKPPVSSVQSISGRDIGSRQLHCSSLPGRRRTYPTTLCRSARQYSRSAAHGASPPAWPGMEST
ncbi:hypothetical protein T07_1038 [Trichinella nelsoni]|uniref:Uncharacterized protein n=1 Tax=Trichinella nelsoni TaxID=6336 RepID=A0A0V0RG50_9BILA|nr:hypothetical protein T07_1038 [Trichinella nelsoni]